MLSSTIERALNGQIEIEAKSSQAYLAMASWAENKGLNGVANFLYEHSNEERFHMLKLIRFVNERGGTAIVPALSQPVSSFNSVKELFEELLNHEVEVTNEINKVVDACLQEKDYTTHNFMQWYVSEQLEEEALARSIMDKLNIIGEDQSGLYFFDRDLETISSSIKQEEANN